jgi:hypothetical protein
MKIDINKPPGFYTYRNGEPARILCVDAPGEWPVRAMCDSGEITEHGLDGIAAKRYIEPLIEIPEAREPREWDALILPDGSLAGYSEGAEISPDVAKTRVREILPGKPKGLCESLGLPADSFAKFIKEQEEKELAEQRELRERIKKSVTEGAIPTSFPPVPETPEEPNASYPPPESEWPEMPDAGEGMVWERVWSESGEEEVIGLLDDEVTGKLEWFRINGWTDDTLVFRAIPTPVVVNDILVGEHQAETLSGKGLRDVHETDFVNTEDPEESRAKAALRDGWLWFGRGPLKVKPDSMGDNDLAGFNEDSMWVYKNWSGNLEIFYAIRTGSELAKANGLEPAEPRYRELGPDDGVFLPNDEVSSKQNGPDKGWLTADKVGIVGSKISDYSGLRARRLVTEPGEDDPIASFIDGLRGYVLSGGVDERHLDHVKSAIEALTGKGGDK